MIQRDDVGVGVDVGVNVGGDVMKLLGSAAVGVGALAPEESGEAVPGPGGRREGVSTMRAAFIDGMAVNDRHTANRWRCRSGVG